METILSDTMRFVDKNGLNRPFYEGSMEGSSHVTANLEKVLVHVDQVSQTVNAGDKISSAQANRLISSMAQATQSLSKVANSPIHAKETTVDPKMLNRMSHALNGLGGAVASNQIKGPTAATNLANVIQGLANEIEKVQKRQVDKNFLKKGKKVEKYEVVEFLNATEKEFEQFIAKLKERDPEEEELLELVLVILRKIGLFRSLRSLKLDYKVSTKVSPELKKRLLFVIKQLRQEPTLKEKIRKAGTSGSQKNAHLRFWNAMKQFEELVKALT